MRDINLVVAELNINVLLMLLPLLLLMLLPLLLLLLCCVVVAMLALCETHPVTCNMKRGAVWQASWAWAWGCCWNGQLTREGQQRGRTWTWTLARQAARQPGRLAGHTPKTYTHLFCACNNVVVVQLLLLLSLWPLGPCLTNGNVQRIY